MNRRASGKKKIVKAYAIIACIAIAAVLGASWGTLTQLG